MRYVYSYATHPEAPKQKTCLHDGEWWEGTWVNWGDFSGETSQKVEECSKCGTVRRKVGK